MPNGITPRQKTVTPILQEKNFAATLIELEIAVEMQNFVLKDIQILMNLYARAVDYYMSVQSNNYLYFQNKMKKLLLIPKVIKTLNSEECDKPKPQVQPKKKEKRKVSNSEVVMKRQNFELNKKLNSIDQKNDIERMIVNYSSKRNNKNKLIKSSLNNQTCELKKRLKSRRINMSRNVSINTSQVQKNFNFKTADISKEESMQGGSKGKFLQGGFSIIKNLFLEEEYIWEKDRTKRI